MCGRIPRVALAVTAAGCVSAGATARAAQPLVPGPSESSAHVATIVHEAAAYRAPWDRRAIGRVATHGHWGGGRNRLLVLSSAQVADPRHGGERRLWLRVALPQRPNGSSGWIEAGNAVLRTTPWRIEISTRTRRVTVRRAGRVVRRFGAVVGARATPTPHGLFAVYEPIRQPDPGAFLGPWALHLTAFSNVLENFGGGPGRVAIHGRSGASLADPLGTARSHGCVRVRNDEIRFLARVARAGTPVRIL